VDSGKLAVFVLLDFSKAFNSINFVILKNKLINLFNFSNEASDLIFDYLS